MTSSPTIIFDFDGTIAQSLELGVQMYNRFAEEKGFKKIENFEEMQGKSVRSLMREFGVRIWDLPFIVKEARKAMRDEIAKAEPTPGIREVLIELKQKGHILGILSSNSEENIRLYLQAHDLELFDFVHSSSNIFGKHLALRKILKQMTLRQENVIYVGDEIRDIDACKKCGIRCIAVTWGFNREDILMSHHPEWIARSPKDLLKTP